MKEAQKISSEMTEKQKKELFSVNSKVKGEHERCKGDTWSATVLPALCSDPLPQ